jgi:hypothetical protein
MEKYKILIISIIGGILAIGGGLFAYSKVNETASSNKSSQSTLSLDSSSSSSLPNLPSSSNIGITVSSIVPTKTNSISTNPLSSKSVPSDQSQSPFKPQPQADKPQSGTYIQPQNTNTNSNLPLKTFKKLNIEDLKKTQLPGPNVKITNGTFKITGGQNREFKVNSGVDGLNLIIPVELFESAGYYFPNDKDNKMIINPATKGIPLDIKRGDIIKITADFEPLLSNPPRGYDKIDYVMVKVYKSEVLVK